MSSPHDMILAGCHDGVVISFMSLSTHIDVKQGSLDYNKTYFV